VPLKKFVRPPEKPFSTVSVNFCRAISRNARLLYPTKLPRRLFAIEAVEGQNPPHAPAAKKPDFSPWDNTKPVTDLPIGP
jgi:hypothetical protein